MYLISKAQEPTRKPWRVEVKDGCGPSRIIETYETKREALAVASRLNAKRR